MDGQNVNAFIIAVYLMAGAAMGTLYFGSLWWNTRRFGQGGQIYTLLAGTAARLALLGGALWATSLEGAMPLLATALGVLLARAAVMRRVRSIAP